MPKLIIEVPQQTFSFDISEEELEGSLDENFMIDPDYFYESYVHETMQNVDYDWNIVK